MTEANPVEQEKVNTVSPLNAILVVAVTFGIFLFLGAIFLLKLGTGPTLILSELLILIVPLSYMLVKRVNIKSFVGLDFKPKFIPLCG